MSDRPIELIFGVNDDNPLDVTWGPWMLAGMDYRPARKRVDLITAEDSDGAIPLGQAHADNMMIGIRLRIDEGASMDAALDQMHRLQKKLDDAARRSPDGLECVWRPEGASERSTFFVLEGEIAEAPQEMSGADIGWYHKSPIVVVTLICKPFFYGDWSTPVVASGTTPLIEAELENVRGDVDAEGEMTVTDLESVDRSHFEWGLEQYGYDPTAPEDTLLNLASGLTVTGYAGSSSTESGSYSANTVEGTAYTSDGVAACATSGQAHIGTKRIKIRAKGSTTAIRYRLAWRVGDGSFSRGDWVYVPVAAEYCELDLGVIEVQPPESGTHRWEGHIEVSDADDALGTYVIDYAEVLPAERYGKIRAPYAEPTFSDLVGFDNFSAASGAVTGDTSTDGQTWASMGGVSNATDFQAGAGDTITRTATSDTTTNVRYGRGLLLGSATPYGIRVAVTLNMGGAVSSPASGVIARFVDNSNFICGYWRGSSTQSTYVVDIVVAGTVTRLADETVLDGGYNTYSGAYADRGLMLDVLPDGTWAISSDGIVHATGVHSALAAGGALDNGQVGIFDWSIGGSGTRTFSNFRALEMADPSMACYADQDLIVAHDRAERYDSTGTYTATPPQVRGSRLWIPPAGDQNKTTRIVSKLRRYDVDTLPDSAIDDDHQISIRYRPRYRNPIGTP